MRLALPAGSTDARYRPAGISDTRACLAVVALVLAGWLLLSPAAVRAATEGSLSQLPGEAACTFGGASEGQCADGFGFGDVRWVAVAPDGAHAYVASPSEDSVVVFRRDTESGALDQHMPERCVASPRGPHGCRVVKGLHGPNHVALSPDGRNAYVTNYHGDIALAVFARDPATGVLSQLEGRNGCVYESTGSGPDCLDGRNLESTRSVALSPDGRFVYVASHFGPDTDGSGVGVFARDTSTGAVRQLEGPSGCVTETGSGGMCAEGDGLLRAESVTVSPDGENLYVASSSDAVAAFARDPETGAITQLAGGDACVAKEGWTDVCRRGEGLDWAASVTVSPDGRSVYVASYYSGAVALFRRDRATGGLRQLDGQAGCISETGSDGACTDGRGLAGAESAVVSPDGKSAYVTGANRNALAAFARDPVTGGLSQLPGLEGCVSADGSDGECRSAMGLATPASVALSPDGKHAYVGSRSFIAAFARLIPAVTDADGDGMPDGRDPCPDEPGEPGTGCPPGPTAPPPAAADATGGADASGCPANADAATTEACSITIRPVVVGGTASHGRAHPGLRVTQVRISQRGLIVTGRLARDARGRIAASWRWRMGQRLVKTRSATRARRGRFRLVLRPGARLRKVTRGRLLVRFGGDDRYRRQAIVVVLPRPGGRR